jgi:hypothetical protein
MRAFHFVATSLLVALLGILPAVSGDRYSPPRAYSPPRSDTQCTSRVEPTRAADVAWQSSQRINSVNGFHVSGDHTVESSRLAQQQESNRLEAARVASAREASRLDANRLEAARVASAQEASRLDANRLEAARVASVQEANR